MKKIAEGGNCRTEINTLIAEADYATEYEEQPTECTGRIYRSPTGVYFVVEQLQVGHDNGNEAPTLEID